MGLGIYVNLITFKQLYIYICTNHVRVFLLYLFVKFGKSKVTQFPLKNRLDDLILEAITKLKEPRGSSRHTIAEYIEDHHSAPPDFERILAASLKLLTEKGQLIKIFKGSNKGTQVQGMGSTDAPKVGLDSSIPQSATISFLSCKSGIYQKQQNMLVFVVD
ncbi:hypothetical protein Pfo_023713 [Paulownia fortunei]|nr:hypothetical protein Pfo_023713 [Paulownia fortunei]